MLGSFRRRDSESGADKEPVDLSPLKSWWHGEGVPFDRLLLVASLILMGFGLVMVTSASMPEAERLTDIPMYFAIRHAIFLFGACAVAAVVMQIPVDWWDRNSSVLLLIALALMVAVLLPGIGHTVKGATRWIRFGFFNLQVAEIAKLTFFVYLSAYLVRRLKVIHHHDLKRLLVGILVPFLVAFVLAVLLLAQPDLGSLAVIGATMMGLLWLGGAPLGVFASLMGAGILAMVGFIYMEPYRLRRVTAFMDPWADPFGDGYQLTQSLMAFGRGGFSGQGLGNSIQKLHYLPEAHNDFLVAIIAEELGFIGVCLLVGLLLLLILRGFSIGRRALHQKRLFAGFLAYAISIWFTLQSIVNIGSAAGAMPPKGLTLPLVSYGGSSLLVMSAAVALLMRIDYEGRVAASASDKKKPARKPRRQRAADNTDTATELVQQEPDNA